MAVPVRPRTASVAFGATKAAVAAAAGGARARKPTSLSRVLARLNESPGATIALPESVRAVKVRLDPGAARDPAARAFLKKTLPGLVYKNGREVPFAVSYVQAAEKKGGAEGAREVDSSVIVEMTSGSRTIPLSGPNRNLEQILRDLRNLSSAAIPAATTSATSPQSITSANSPPTTPESVESA